MAIYDMDNSEVVMSQYLIRIGFWGSPVEVESLDILISVLMNLPHEY